MEEKEYLLVDDVYTPVTEEDLKNLNPIVEDFVDSYEKNQERPIEEWLSEKLQSELPEKSADEVRAMANEVVESVRTFENKKESLNETLASGRSKESWFEGEVKKATCEEQGMEKRVCSGCNTEETRNSSKLSHTYGEWSISKNPTATEAGSKERTCSCGHVDVQVIPAGTIIDTEDENESNTDDIVGDNTDDDSKEPSQDTNANRGGNTILWKALGIALLLILLILLFLLLKRRKEDDKGQPTVEL